MAKDGISTKEPLAFRPQTWNGAAWGVVAVTFGVMAAHVGLTRASGAASSDVVALLAVLPLCVVVGAATVWLIRLLCRTSNRFLFALVFAGPVLYVAFYSDNTLPAAQMLSLATLVLATLVGGSVGAFASSSWRESSWFGRGVALLAFIVGTGSLAWGIYWHLDDGSPASPLIAVTGSVNEVPYQDLSDPSAPGPFGVRTLTYGSGTDRHRPEYGDNVDLRTEPVDGKPFLSGWQRLRTSYWGFGADELPLNGFNIRSVVAIAPADRQYMPAGHTTPLVDVSYLTLQGSLDMDAASFMGAWQYQRVEFTEGHPGFKASVYIHGANHGQFNSTWGRADNFGLGIRRHNLEQIMPEEAQQPVAKVYISAFLATTLQDRQESLPMFRDHRKAAPWLPDKLYIARFEDANTELVCTWEEDIDLTTTTFPGGSISAENLHLWREDEVWMRFGPLGSYAVYLGWDTENQERTPSYRITLPDAGLDLRAEDALIFSLADAREERGGADPIDLSIEVTDRDGAVAALPLSRVCERLRRRVRCLPRHPYRIRASAVPWARHKHERGHSGNGGRQKIAVYSGMVC
jgi:hypothetical protein